LAVRIFFTNGIHLNVIKAASDPSLESWCINAIDDLVLEIPNTMSRSGLSRQRRRGRREHEGVVLNPHYKSMGGLYGSENWTYTLPRRVGAAKATPFRG
jgi:putative two-component system protein, hydrogenase maturation factor HypX/HoxX